MENFLKKLQLSDDSVQIYLKCLGQRPFTYNELFSTIPNMTQDVFSGIMSELMSLSLFVQINPKKPDIPLHFLAIPPVSPITDYYENIKVSVSNIETAIKDLMVNSLSEILHSESKEGSDNPYEQFLEIKNDIDEDTMIQKQDVDDLLEELGELNEIKNAIVTFRQNLKTITQTQFANIIKTMNKIKLSILASIPEHDLKKKEEPIINLIENIFSQRFDEEIQSVMTQFDESVEGGLTEFENPINQIVENSSKSQIEYKTLYLNAVSNHQAKINEIEKIIQAGTAGSKDKYQSLESQIIENLNEIVVDSVNQISGLNQPIETVLQNYLQYTTEAEKLTMDNLHFVNSIAKAREILQNLITNSKNELVIIIPRIEDYLTFDQFQNLNPGLKIKLVSSDPHVNSLVMNLKSIPNLEFRNLQNPNIIAFKSDNSHVSITIQKDNLQDPLEDCVGFGSNYIPLVNILGAIITTTWNSAKGEGGPTVAIPTTPTSAITQPKPTPAYTPQPTTTLTPQAPPPQEVPAAAPVQLLRTTQPQGQVNYVSQVQAKPGDPISAEVNNAFNSLIAMLGTFTGAQFSKELEVVADMILEKKGFSVTMHNIRRWINTYKEKNVPLDANDQQQLFDAIENWKQRLV